MASRLLIVFIVAIFIFPAADCEAQKLKLPNFLPFKKKTKEVKPFQLSDRSGKQAASGKQKPMFDFLKPRPKSNKKSGSSDFNNRSKAFFDKTGNGLDKFSENTKKFFGEAWSPPQSRKAWWNQGPKQTAPVAGQNGVPFGVPNGSQGFGRNMANKALGFGRPAQPQRGVQQPPAPNARSARQYQYGQPKHRFK